MHCNALQHTATHCNTLQHTTVHCNTLQHTATHCNTLEYTATDSNSTCSKDRRRVAERIGYKESHADFGIRAAACYKREE